MEENIKKNTIWNVIGTGINAFASLIFMIIVTRVNDINEAGLFSFAFSTAILFNVIGTYCGRIYQVTERKDISNKEFLVHRVITCILMLVVTFIFVLIKNYDINKIILIMTLCFLKMIEAFCDVVYGFLQRKGKLYKVGISLTLKNIIGLIVFLIVDVITKNLLLATGSFIFVYILIMLIYDFIQSDIKEQKNDKLKKKNIIDIFKNGFPTFCVTFLNLYLINASKYALDNIMTDDYQAIFGIILMPATIMILLAQFMVHPFLNIISNYIEKNDYKSLNKLIIKISLLLTVIGCLAIVFCYFIGIYILEIIYGISLIDYNICLSIILLGSIFSALTSVVITVLIAMRHTVVQMVGYIIISVITFITSNILVSNFGIMGASVNYTITMVLTFVTFLIVYLIFEKKQKNEKI
jgi:O-antigen/teichoic acid export membrane protein